MTSERGNWATRTGFILAAAGSAVGLGNIWGFPTQVGRNGGSAFVLVYLICIALICVPILIGEIAIGRRAQQSPAAAFRVIRPGTSWWLVGGLGVLAGIGILSFYSVIAGWAVAYIWFMLTGGVSGDQAAAGAFFTRFSASGWTNVGLTLVVLAVTASVVVGGVRSGIERVTSRMMPALIVLLLVLVARATMLPGAAEGLSYYLRPDLTRLTDVSLYPAALGQAFFSLSLGMGCMLTYGSYLSKRQGIAGAALGVILLDTAIALVAGFIIFPAGFSIAGFDPTSSGPGLIFQVLPYVFGTLPGGHLFGAAFFLLLTMAALTSTISLLEVPVAHCVDTLGWPRRRAAWVMSGSIFVLAVPSALASGAAPMLTQLPGLGMDFLSLMITLWNELALPIGGLLTAVFIGWVWGIDDVLAEVRAHGARFPFGGAWAVLVRWICPLGILGILLPALWALL